MEMITVFVREHQWAVLGLYALIEWALGTSTKVKANSTIEAVLEGALKLLKMFAPKK